MYFNSAAKLSASGTMIFFDISFSIIINFFFVKLGVFFVVLCAILILPDFLPIGMARQGYNTEVHKEGTKVLKDILNSIISSVHQNKI